MSQIIIWIILLVAITLWSFINPHDYPTWWMEAAPVFIGGTILLATLKKFPFTPLVYRLMWLHAVVLLVGAHYTYAEVPLFNWLRDSLDLSRNHYDKVGHFIQGFVPAMITRESFHQHGCKLKFPVHENV